VNSQKRFVRYEIMRAANSVCSPPQPMPGLPGFGDLKTCRKRASPQPAGRGWGWGSIGETPHDPHRARSAAKLAQAPQACLRARDPPQPAAGLPASGKLKVIKVRQAGH
jgi:hypothetical protein